MLVEVRRQFGRELKPSFLQTTDQRPGNGSAEHPIGFGRAVAAPSQVADFILNLDHEDRLLLRVFLADVAHINDAKARLSHRRASDESSERICSGVPSAASARGNRLRSDFTQDGA